MGPIRCPHGRDRVEAAGRLAALMDRLNRLIAADHHGERFMTMHVSLIDAEARTVRWVTEATGARPAI